MESRTFLKAFAAIISCKAAATAANAITARQKPLAGKLVCKLSRMLHCASVLCRQHDAITSAILVGAQVVRHATATCQEELWGEFIAAAWPWTMWHHHAIRCASHNSLNMSTSVFWHHAWYMRLGKGTLLACHSCSMMSSS